MDGLTKEEKSLLLYLEARSVDSRGSIHQKNLNADDFQTLHKWQEAEYVQFGRIASASQKLTEGAGYWCELSQEAWEDAHRERKARAARMKEKRQWVTVEELRNELVQA